MELLIAASVIIGIGILLLRSASGKDFQPNSAIAKSAGLISSHMVYEGQWALEYRDGRFRRYLEPGRHLMVGRGIALLKLEKRLSYIIVPGQEVLTKDNLGLKISLTAEYKVDDPKKLVETLAVNGDADIGHRLHHDLQLILRDVVSTLELDELIAERNQLSDEITTRIKESASAWGVDITSVSVRDLMLSKELRSAYAAVVLSKKEAEAKLERARGETAALRALSNAARSLRNNPELMKLRLLDGVQSSQGARHNLWVDFKDVEKIVGDDQKNEE